jgi:branched-chain amino acid transport system substrate-binding protein
VLKTASDPAWKTDKGVGEYRTFIKEWIPEADPDDSGAATGYNVASLLAYILRQCGDDLTRENILKVATTLKEVDLPMLLPGIRINTSPTNYQPFSKLQMQRFDGSSWALVGDPIDMEARTR